MAAIVDGKRASVTARRPERRQLTVLFCDLVGSTELSQRLDPEDLREVIRCYQRACQPVISRYGGFLSRFLGDGILALFGYPRAHGNDAERAVHAGVELVAAVRSVSSSTRCGETLELSVRVGIATGLVVAGDLIGKDAAEEEAVVGETPNLAARLQSLAAPNSVLVGERTKRLVERRFRMTAMGRRALKGFADPVEVWRVDAPADESGHPGTRAAVTATAIIDREEELRYLVERWNGCVAGRSRLVVITGEAGIGKSRVAQALRDHIAYTDHYFLRYQCSPYHANTAYFPVITHYERAARLAPGDSPTEKLAKLRSLIRSPEERGNATLSALASLLSISNGDDEAFESLSAIGKRHAIYNALFEQLAELSRLRPVLALVEDIHWSDPTTLELMKRFHADQGDERILMVVTNRTDSDVSWRDFPDAGHVEMSRLGTEYSTDLVRQVASGVHLAPGLAERIVAKADGVPLFVEELTKTLLDPHFEGKSGGTGNGVGGTSPIPDTLQDLLTARLDRLGDGKRIAQVASVIGRQFSHALLERVVDCDDTALQDGLQRLSASGLLFSEGSSPEITYTFKHALVRDTAYASLVRDERRALHLRTAEMLQGLEERPSPELLARHYTEADVPGRAIECWLRAGQDASQRSAHREALEQFQSGLDMVRAQIAGQDRDRWLLEYLIHLGPVMIATRGSGAPETEAVYREAVSLTRSLPEAESHFIALWGWWRISKDFLVKSERAAELQCLAERLDDEGLVLQAHHCQWATRFHLGDHESCRKHIDAGIELYVDRDHRSHAARFGGHDPRVCALGEAAQSAWLTGQTDKADVLMRKARLWADELKQSGSLVHVMDMNLLLTRYRCDPRAAVRQARELIGFAKEREFPEYVAKAEVFLGWALAKGRRRREGIDMMRAAIASHDNIGTREDPPVWLEMLADGYLESGDYRAGLDTVDEAFEHTAQSGLRFWRAELYRRRGALLVGLGEEHLVEARECFRDAIAVCAAQGALSLELRATTALAKVESRLDGSIGAVAALERVLARFTEGFGSPDYREAKAVCEKLRVSSARPVADW